MFPTLSASDFICGVRCWVLIRAVNGSIQSLWDSEGWNLYNFFNEALTIKSVYWSDFFRWLINSNDFRARIYYWTRFINHWNLKCILTLHLEPQERIKIKISTTRNVMWEFLIDTLNDSASERDTSAYRKKRQPEIIIYLLSYAVLVAAVLQTILPNSTLQQRHPNIYSIRDRYMNDSWSSERSFNSFPEDVEIIEEFNAFILRFAANHLLIYN